MKAGKLNTTRIKLLKPKQKRYLLADCDGLYLEIHPSGLKSWRIRYRRDGKPAKTNIGHWPELSLDEAREHLRRTKPTLFSQIVGVTVREFGARYMREIVSKKRKEPGDVQRYLDCDVYPVIGNKAAEKVTVADLRTIIFSKREQGSPQAALAVRDVLKRLFDYAVVCGVISANPVLAIPRQYIATAVSRTRTLSAEEAGRFVCVLEAASLRPNLRAALHLLLLTLTRKIELLLARWEHIDLRKGEWSIPAEHTKNKKPHIVYLSSQAVRILETLADSKAPKHHVIPSMWSKTQPISEATLNRALERISDGMDHFTVHDLRRTASTLLSEDEYEADVIEKALNHSTKGVRGIYNRAQYREQRRKMLQDWADKVDDYAIEYREKAANSEPYESWVLPHVSLHG